MLTTDALVHKIVACKRTDLVQPLVKKGWFDVNHMDLKGFTPLTYACVVGHLPMVEALVMAGADASMTVGDGASPLMLAVYSRHLHVVQYLLCQGVTTGLDEILTFAVIRSDLEILQVRSLSRGLFLHLNATNPFYMV